MRRPNSTTYQLESREITLRNKAVDAVISAIGTVKGQTIFEIADKANVSLGYVRTVIKCVPAAQQLKQDGYILVSAKGPVPDWAADVPDIQRASSTALVAAPELPATISHPDLREEVTEKVDTFRRILRKTYLSPRSQRKELEALTSLEVVSAEREEEHMRYVQQLEEQRAGLEALNKALREHAELLKGQPNSVGARALSGAVEQAPN